MSFIISVQSRATPLRQAAYLASEEQRLSNYVGSPKMNAGLQLLDARHQFHGEWPAAHLLVGYLESLEVAKGPRSIGGPPSVCKPLLPPFEFPVFFTSISAVSIDFAKHVFQVK